MKERKENKNYSLSLDQNSISNLVIKKPKIKQNKLNLCD